MCFRSRRQVCSRPHPHLPGRRRGSHLQPSLPSVAAWKASLAHQAGHHQVCPGARRELFLDTSLLHQGIVAVAWPQARVLWTLASLEAPPPCPFLSWVLTAFPPCPLPTVARGTTFACSEGSASPAVSESHPVSELECLFPNLWVSSAPAHSPEPTGQPHQPVARRANF